MEIYLRELEENDAKISYIWRNNPNIWKLTGNKPDKEITYEIELDWIKQVLKRNNEKRFAICINGTNQYIGNIQLTNINNNSAEFHIFIGEEIFWGMGFGTQATKLILDYGFNRLALNEIYLFVDDKNISALKTYEKSGFKILTNSNGKIKMNIFK